MYRPDILYRSETHCVVVEIDEKQHKTNLEILEKKRMQYIKDQLNLPVTFIRYNPDKYSIEGKLQQTPTNERLEQLAKVLLYSLTHIEPNETVHKLFFNTH
jgi:hypothetical protein